MVTVDARGNNCPVETSTHKLQPSASRMRKKISRYQPRLGEHHDWWKSHSAILKGFDDVNYAHRTEHGDSLTEQRHPAWLLSLVEVGGKWNLSESHHYRFHPQDYRDGYRVSFPPG